MTCPSLLSGERANPSEAMEAAGALPSGPSPDPPPPPGPPPAGPRPLPARGRGKDTGPAGDVVSSLFYTQCPEKHFDDM